MMTEDGLDSPGFTYKNPGSTPDKGYRTERISRYYSRPKIQDGEKCPGSNQDQGYLMYPDIYETQKLNGPAQDASSSDVVCKHPSVGT